MSKLILCLLLLLNIYVCEDSKVRVFTQNDAKNEIKVRLGEEFSIKLRSNPSTGYTWTFLNQEEIKESLILLRKYSEKTQLGQKRILIGAGGFLYFHFKALEVTNGTVPIKLSYSRFWMKTKSIPTTTFKVNVY